METNSSAKTAAQNDTFDLKMLLQALRSVCNGDFSTRLPDHWAGLEGKIADAFNDVVASNERMAEELERVRVVIGKEGNTAHRASFERRTGAWKGMEASINRLIDDLLWPTREITNVVSAVSRGDLSQRLCPDIEGRSLQGEFLRAATIVNSMIQQLHIFASEVTRVAREVGTEGKLGGQAQVGGATGVWKDLTDGVNSMASNLTAQVRNISDVTIAVASGDLSHKITVDVRGELLQLKEAVNTMVDQLRSFASEVIRVAREVGTDGRLGGQAIVPGVAGTWKDLTDSVNAMCANLTDQVRNIAGVTTAVARGDLSRKITVNVNGELLELKNTINTMVDQLNGFAAEVTRVAREVGTEGKLGGQAEVAGVAGTWRDLTDSVNFMANNLTTQVRNIAEVSTAIACGDLSKKITVNASGEILLLKETINTMVDRLNAFASEVTRVAREVGTDGRLGGQAQVAGVAGTWKDLTDSVNSMANNLTAQVRNIAGVTTAVARGDLSRKITVSVNGELLELKNTINTMVDQLNGFASEVTRVAHEVGTEGRLGGQAQVPGVAGTWKDLTDNVNIMAANLTEQVRGIVKVVTAVAEGDLKQKLAVNARGEVAALTETINNMMNTLATFAEQVTTVAHEVGVDGRLGGQANVPGAAGTWRDLTGNVNLLAANLTNQVRAIAEVATAVTEGDLTRSIQVDACGELSELKDNINTMIDNLRLTTDRNAEQDWLKTNLARLAGMFQGQRDLASMGRMLLSEVVPLVNAHQGLIYQVHWDSPPRLTMLASYANGQEKGYPPELPLGVGFLGQCAIDKRRILITNVPADTVLVGCPPLQALPRSLVVLPVVFEDQVKAVIALASLNEFVSTHLALLEQLTANMGIMFNSIEATMKTEGLLKQSQQMAGELQRLNLELEQRVSDRTARLQEADRRKDEFLATLAHELRNPLAPIQNSLEIMKLAEGNAGPFQQSLRVINRQVQHMVRLIDDLLDVGRIRLGKIELRKQRIELSAVLKQAIEASQPLIDRFGHNLSLSIPEEPILLDGDATRLAQVFANLLNNSAKFSEEGGRISLSAIPRVGNVEVVVSDNGIGIPFDMLNRVFETFTQVDKSSEKSQSGLGIGLSLAQQLVRMHGGTIEAHSEGVGKGSQFFVRLPLSSSQPEENRSAQTDNSRASVSNGRRILVAEDHEDSATTLALMLQMLGNEVHVARNGVEAIELASRVQPDVIFLDIGLPELNGYDACRRIREQPSGSDMMVVALTGWGQAEDKQRSKEAGFDHHLVKPFDVTMLEKIIVGRGRG